MVGLSRIHFMGRFQLNLKFYQEIFEMRADDNKPNIPVANKVYPYDLRCLVWRKQLSNVRKMVWSPPKRVFLCNLLRKIKLRPPRVFYDIWRISLGFVARDWAAWVQGALGSLLGRISNTKPLIPTLLTVDSPRAVVKPGSKLKKTHMVLEGMGPGGYEPNRINRIQDVTPRILSPVYWIQRDCCPFVRFRHLL